MMAAIISPVAFRFVTETRGEREDTKRAVNPNISKTLLNVGLVFE